MEYARLGNSGLKVSRICLGMMSYGDPAWRDWVLPQDAAFPFIRKALDYGINFFDTANMYSNGESERILGNALREFHVPRDEVVIASKVYFPLKGPKPNCGGLSRKHIMESVDATLGRLGLDYLDLYQIHRWDSETPIEETMGALHDLVRSGKVRYIGASSMYAWQFAKAQHIAELRGFTKFISMQNHYNLIYREEEREMNPFCVSEGVGLIPWSPLARGFLAGNRGRDGTKAGETTRAKSDDFAKKMYFDPSDFEVVDVVQDVAKEHGVKPAQVALAWLLQRPGVVAPIIGATKMAHLDDAVAALKVKLSAEDVKRLEEKYKPHPVLGHS
eukprot:TRINITY_DN8167_c0_g1_i1.p1 TRINITY_DN8167_c0_g1~~TRINITY_DN8167_c0_g1_i1.p1  ORF type:complete len:331 (+),score=70.31 TRINITY_DN8167_c0_g1_i1:32-1024(+)